MNLRTLQGPLKRNHCRALEHAWHQAAKDGYPLNALVSIRPAANLTSLEHAKLVAKIWNNAAVWSRRHVAKKTFHAILVRETVPVNNFHLLMHVEGNAKLSLLRRAVARWLPTPGDADVRRAHQAVSYTPSGKFKSALGYITKERMPQAAWAGSSYLWQWRKGAGAVLGKRYKITANLRARPIDIAVRPVEFNQRKIKSA